MTRLRKRKLGCLAIATVVAGMASAGEGGLLKSRGGMSEVSSIACCTPDELAKPEGKRRCLERLTRDDSPDQARSACAAVVGMGFAQTLGNQNNCTANAGNLIGIQTSEMRDQGWYQNDIPKTFQGPALFPAELAAAGSKACDSFLGSGVTDEQWQARQNQCSRQGGYETVHLYVSIAHDYSDDMAASVAVEDPWWKDPRYKNRVYLVRSEKRDEVRTAIANLLMSCKIVSYVYVSSHGSSGYIYWGEHGKLGGQTIGDFMNNLFSPCMLAPGARVQLDGCAMSCGSGAEALRQGFDRILKSSDYRSTNPQYAQADPFEGVQIYTNTDMGANYIPPGILHAVGFRPHAFSENGLGIVYTRHAGAFTTDIPTDKAPACKKDGFALGSYGIEAVRSGE